MSGCYGNSREDQHFEIMLDEHTKEWLDGNCDCDIKTHEEEKGLFIEGIFYGKKEIEHFSDCPNCGLKLDTNELI
jgi:hypothetical protein